MKPHKHAELIKKWVDGIECEYHIPYADKWEEINFLADFDTRHTVRIKPEPKPDVVTYLSKEFYHLIGYKWHESNFKFDTTLLKIIWDGETGKLKSAEVIK
jgi:hypothetical protein